MKKVLFSLVVMTLMAVGAQAQKSSCSKTCTTKPAAASVSCGSESSAAAAKLASMDASIESRTCPVSGTVSYVRKETGKNGAVSFVDVSYDAATNTFVNVSPVKTEAAKASCGTSATTVSMILSFHWGLRGDDSWVIENHFRLPQPIPAMGYKDTNIG